MNKKGSFVMDIFFIGVLVLLLGGFILVMNVAVSDIDEVIINEDISNESAKHYTVFSDNFNETYDAMILFIFVMLGLGFIISSYLLDAPPVFYFIGIILLIILSVAFADISNVWDDVRTDQSLPDPQENTPFIDYILSNLPLLMGIFGLGALIVMFMKVGGGGT